MRFASLGVQSYHHDEVITAAAGASPAASATCCTRSRPASPTRRSTTCSPGAGRRRSAPAKSACARSRPSSAPPPFRSPTASARELPSRRAGLIAAALVAVNPMLIWYSQEARSYALLVFFCAVSLLFFVRALRHPRRTRPRALGAGLGARPLQPLLRRLRGRDRGRLAAGRAARPAGALVLPAVAAVGVGRPGPAAAGRRPGQPDPHRLDRKQPALRPASSRPASASWSARPAT